MVFKCPRDGGFCLPKIEWLHQIIERSEAQRIDGTLDGLHPADHDDHGFRGDRFDVRYHLQTAHSGHGDVTDD